ncbi:MAG: hypothetical protein ACLU8S_21885 [Coprococcus phoceensis]
MEARFLIVPCENSPPTNNDTKMEIKMVVVPANCMRSMLEAFRSAELIGIPSVDIFNPLSSSAASSELPAAVLYPSVLQKNP